MTVEIAAVSYLLSSVASVGQIIESAMSLLRTKKFTFADFEAIEARANEETARIRESGGYSIPAIANSPMTSQVVEQIHNEMRKIVGKMKAAMADPRYSASEKLDIVKIEQKEYCGHLAIIKQFNGGVLPADLEDDWAKNNCDSF